MDPLTFGTVAPLTRCPGEGVWPLSVDRRTRGLVDPQQQQEYHQQQQQQEQHLDHTGWIPVVANTSANVTANTIAPAAAPVAAPAVAVPAAAPADAPSPTAVLGL